MSRSFRYAPPAPRADSLVRPRLLRTLTRRWEHKVTALTGGAGLGKTTLLAQAIAENQLAPRGQDVWVGVEASDADADRFSRVVAAALAGHSADPDSDAAVWDQPVPEPTAVAGAVWQRAPTEACIVLDDVHLLPPSSTGASWLTELVGALPANGHVLLASRSEPPVPLARLGLQGAVLRLIEDQLRFDDDELVGFAARRGVDPKRFDDTGGWPAMAELAASVDDRFTGSYLWEEVLEPLGTIRRHVLAVLSDLGGADDELASAAVGMPVDLARSLQGIPLVTRGSDGWYVPHGLWRAAPELALSTSERVEVRRRAIQNLADRDRYDDAFTLLQEVGLWELAPPVLRRACLASDRLAAGNLGRWLAVSTDGVRASPAGQLATGLLAAFTEPAKAIEPLQTAVAANRAAGDVESELTAIAQLARLGWFRQDRTFVDELAPRITELEVGGHPRARGLAGFRRALAADLRGDDDTVLDELGTIDPNVLDPAWEVLASYLSGSVHFELGNYQAAVDIAERLAPTADPALQPFVTYLQFRARWTRCQLDEVIEAGKQALEAERRTGVSYHLYLMLTMLAHANAHLGGETRTGRRLLEEALAVAPPPAAGRMSVTSAVVLAEVQLAEGDEAAAAATLREAIEVHGLDQGADRRAWRQTLPLSYVLLPETRAHWDELARRGQRKTVTALSRVVVAIRAGQGDVLLRDLRPTDPDLFRAALHHRLAAEIAVGLAAVGRSEGRLLLDALGPAGRDAVRAIAAGEGRTHRQQAKRAQALLAAVPAPPPRSTYLAVLGSLVLRRDGPDGEEVVDPDLHRKRVQGLLAFLVARRRTTRSAISAALWPDLDERSAANNLSVTLNHVLRLLEPWRDAGQPAYLLRVEGQAVHLVTGEHLRIDVDEFDEHVTRAAQAETDGVPSVALDHNLAAVGLYRDELHLDLPEADWFGVDREHYRTRFVAAAVRAGQLLLGRGSTAQAEGVAQRALDVDQWSEDAYAVLVNAALARDDRSGARRILARCVSTLTSLDLQPSEATRQLARRVNGSG